MNFRAKPYQPELLDKRPRTIRTETSAEFFAVCEREKAGEFAVTALDVFGPDTGNGGRNGHYEFEVRWNNLRGGAPATSEHNV